jgi:hydrogenase nickel incorporation protein HypB
MTETIAPRVVAIEKAVLGKNQAAADRLRDRYLRSKTLVINIMSSPGSGKTALLEKTLAQLGASFRTAVIVGDLATDNDARRLSGHGAEIVQVTTGGYCHLDAGMVTKAIDEIAGQDLDILIIENVGNLVCPSAFDLGEDLRIGLLSVTEGEDKPVKYPSLFSRVEAVVISKIDIADVVGWSRPDAIAALAVAAPRAKVFELSSRSGTGMDAWIAWISERIADKKAG